MKLDIDQHANNLSITAYSNEGITLSGRLLTTPFVVTGNDILLDIVPNSVTAIGPTHIEQLVQLEPSLVIIGTGSTPNVYRCTCFEASARSQRWYRSDEYRGGLS